MLVPVILSGGVGTRLWPLSRELYPKQFLPLVGERTMIQETALRVGGIPGATAPIVVCNEAHRFLVAEQFRCWRSATVQNTGIRSSGSKATVLPSMPTSGSAGNSMP